MLSLNIYQKVGKCMKNEQESDWIPFGVNNTKTYQYDMVGQHFERQVTNELLIHIYMYKHDMLK